MNHTMKTTCAGLAALLVTTLTAAAVDTVADPFPEKIAASKVAIALEPVGEKLVAPITLVAPDDGSGRLFVVDQPGQVWVVKDGKRLAKPLLDVSDSMVKLKPGFDERGLVGFSLHPDYANKGKPGYGRMYTWTSVPVDASKPHIDVKMKPDSQHVLSEYRVDDHAANEVDLATRRDLMRIDNPQWNHNGGPLVFVGSLLHIAIGDGGAGNDMGPGHGKTGNGQNPTNPFGTVLRIDPLGKSEGKAYGVPSDNPFVGKSGLDEIYAYGLRNVWGMSYDAPTKRLIAADVGQAKIEEINIIKKGGNYGWSIREGSFYFIKSGPQLGQITAEAPTREAYPATIDPVVQYDHDEGISVTGGYVYHGKAIPALVGKYVFGDWKHPDNKRKSGRLFAADLDTGKIEELLVDGKMPGVFVRGFGVGADGELYVLTSKSVGPKGTTGAVYRIVGAPGK